MFRSEYGSSPLHACFVPGTPYVLVQNEYDGHLCSYALNRESGTLTRISRLDSWAPEWDGAERFSLLREMAHPWGIDVQLHPNGRFVFTNNTQGVIATFALNRETGELTLLHRFLLEGSMTRGMQVERSGRFLVVTGVMSEKATVLSIDAQTGALAPVCEVALPTPTALRFIYPEA